MFSFTLSAKNRKRLVCLAKKAVENKGRYNLERGIATNFIKFTESWGVKFSKVSYMPTIFKNQRRAWRHCLGPYCFGLFQVGEFICYITKVETILANMGMKLLQARDYFRKESRRCSDLLDKKIGFSFHDNHWRNCAMVNGVVICIDFGSE